MSEYVYSDSWTKLFARVVKHQQPSIIKFYLFLAKIMLEHFFFRFLFTLFDQFHSIHFLLNIVKHWKSSFLFSTHQKCSWFLINSKCRWIIVMFDQISSWRSIVNQLHNIVNQNKNSHLSEVALNGKRVFFFVFIFHKVKNNKLFQCVFIA